LLSRPLFIEAKINDVKPVSGEHSLQVEFSNGKRYEVDLCEHIRKFPVLNPLQDLCLFHSAQVGKSGFDVTWAGNLELSAVTLHRLALEQTCEVTTSICEKLPS
jgi:hypothetical protein